MARGVTLQKKYPLKEYPEHLIRSVLCPRTANKNLKIKPCPNKKTAVHTIASTIKEMFAFFIATIISFTSCPVKRAMIVRIIRASKNIKLASLLRVSFTTNPSTIKRS